MIISGTPTRARGKRSERHSSYLEISVSTVVPSASYCFLYPTTYNSVLASFLGTNGESWDLGKVTYSKTLFQDCLWKQLSLAFYENMFCWWTGSWIQACLPLSSPQPLLNEQFHGVVTACRTSGVHHSLARSSWQLLNRDSACLRHQPLNLLLLNDIIKLTSLWRILSIKTWLNWRKYTAINAFLYKNPIIWRFVYKQSPFMSIFLIWKIRICAIWLINDKSHHNAGWDHYWILSK